MLSQEQPATMEQQHQKPKQLTLFQAGFKKDEVSRWGVPLAGPSHLKHPPPNQMTSAPASSSATHEGSDVILIDDDDDDLLLAQALDETMSECLNTAPPPAAAAGTPLEVLPGFDADAGTSWVYPVNYPVRQYQYNIVQAAIFENTLVSLPTGLGKTFIAAVLMYNFYRWYPRGKVVFLAPTRPLVAQQIDACYRIMGIPPEDTAELTGSMGPSDRRSCWLQRRVFFLTPQVLNNDLTTGSCPAEQLRCVVIDEAHKALGNHAYCQAVRELSRHTTQFRVLALSATPGSDLKAVIQVLTNLLISRVEVRSEESPDVTPYTHGRQLEKIVVPLGDRLKTVRDKYMQVVRTFVSRLIQLKVVYTRDETTLTKFALLRARDAFKQSPPPGIGGRQIGLVESDFAMSMSLYHALELLQLHGLRSFYSFVQSILRGEKGSARGRAELVRHPVFNELIGELDQQFRLGPEGGSDGGDGAQAAAPAGPADLVQSHPKLADRVQSHPKLARLKELVEQHFRYCGDSTRVMVFSQYRESVLEISAMLGQLAPTVRAMHFIGQSTGRASRGFSQKEQLKVIAAFRSGGFNTLVSTCVGEEGLDIGDVDLIVCYDVSKSPISLVQRMGRTGRKRQGRIVVLLTEGKEEHVYNQSMSQRKSILKTIMTGTKLGPHLFKSSPRMVPRGLRPVCHRLHMTVAASPAVTAARGRGRGRGAVGRGRGRGRTAATDRTGGRLPSLLAALAPDRGPATAAYLTDDQMRHWDARYKLRHADGPARPLALRHTAVASSGVGPSPSGGRPLSLLDWLPWQTTLQSSHGVSHSQVSRNLVHLLGFMAGQAQTGAEAYDQEMMELRRHNGCIEEPSAAACMARPPPPACRPASPAVCGPAEDSGMLTESEQVAEAIRRSLLETSDRDSPPPVEPDWPAVAPPPPPFTAWGEPEGLLAALQEALAVPLLSADEATLMLSAEDASGAGKMRLEARRWLESKQEDSQPMAAPIEVKTERDKLREIGMVEGTAKPEPQWKTALLNGAPEIGPKWRSELLNGATELESEHRADPPEGPSGRPIAGDAAADSFCQDWNADWEWHMSPGQASPPSVTPPPLHPAGDPSPLRDPAPPQPRVTATSPPHPSAVPLLSDGDGSPVLPSQNPNKRRRLSRRGRPRKIELPSAATIPGTVARNEDAPIACVTESSRLGAEEQTANQLTSPAPLKTALSSATTSAVQAGISRRPSSEDLFADESLFARVDEPPALVDEPAASLGFEPVPALATTGSAGVVRAAAAAAAMKAVTGTDGERHREEDGLPVCTGDCHRRRTGSLGAGDVREAHRDQQKGAGSVRQLEIPPQTPAGGRPGGINELHTGGDALNGVERADVAAPPAPETGVRPAPARRRHPSSQPLFDFGIDDDALFADVVTPPQAAEPPPPSVVGGCATVQSVTGTSLLRGPSAGAVSSPLRSPPLLARSVAPLRDSPAAGTSIYSTTQLLELVDQSLASLAAARTPAPLTSSNRPPPRCGTPSVGTKDEQGIRLKETVKERQARVGKSDTGKERTDCGTAVQPARAAAGKQACQSVDRPIFDLFANFFEDSDLFEGVPSNLADPVHPKDPVDRANVSKPAKPVDSNHPTDSAKSVKTAHPAQDTLSAAAEQAAVATAVSSSVTPSVVSITSPAGGTAARAPVLDSPLFTVTRPRPQTPARSATDGPGCVASPELSPILSSQRRPRDTVARRHSTPLSVRGRRRLSRLKQRHSTPLAAPATSAASDTAVSDDPWTEAEFETPRRPAARALCMVNGSARRTAPAPESPLARPTSRLANTDSPVIMSVCRVPDKDSPAVHTVSSGSGMDSPLARPVSKPDDRNSPLARPLSKPGTTKSPLVRPVSEVDYMSLVRPVSVVIDRCSPLARPVSVANDSPLPGPVSVASDSPLPGPVSVASDSHLPGPASAANETDSPVARPAGGCRRRRRPALLRDSEDESPPAGWLAHPPPGEPPETGLQSRSHGGSESRSRGGSESRSHGESESRSHGGSESRSRGESTVSPRPVRDSSSESVVGRPAASKGKRRRRRRVNPFLDDEAEQSASDSGSSDESSAHDSDHYDPSMIDDRLEPTQADVDMRAIYLKSVRSPARAAPGFRRPALPRPTDSELFSQVPHQDDDYEQDSFCVDSDHVESASSDSSPGGSSAGRQRTRRRRIVTLSSSEGERSPAPAARHDASDTLRGDTSTAIRRVFESESDAIFQTDRSKTNHRTAIREKTVTKSSDVNQKATPSDVWLSSKRPAALLPKRSTTAKRRFDPDDVFENSDVNTNKKLHKKRTPPNRPPPVFDLGLFDSDDEVPPAAPLAERQENIASDGADRARQARLERARVKQAEFRRRLVEGVQSSARSAACSGAGAAGSGRPDESSLQSRLLASTTAAAAAGSYRQTSPGRTSADQSGPVTVLASSREVSCAPRVLSDLRAVHRLATEVRPLPAEDYIVSRRAAVVRRPASDLHTVAGRRKVTCRLQLMAHRYPRCWLLLERDRDRPGAAPTPPTADRRPRAADALLARLGRAGVSVLHSDSPEQSASLLSRLAAAERQAGWCLPPPPEAPPLPVEAARCRLLESLPGVSVPLTGDVRREFGSLAEFLQSSPAELERRLGAVTSREGAAELSRALRWDFSPS